MKRLRRDGRPTRIGEEMRKRLKGLRPSPAMIVAVLALIVALGGTAIAGGVLNKKKVNTIITNRAPGLDVKSAKRADTAKKADDADKLGGVSPSGYQGFCKAGAIKGTVVIDTTGMGATYTTVPGFNCDGDVVQVRRINPGVYGVRFVGGAGGTGSAVVTALATGFIGTYIRFNDPTIGNETVFSVNITDSAGSLTDNKTFSLLAF
jgi:hypothetical protein